MVWDIILLFGGFVPVILGARWFVEGAAACARVLRVPPMAIGLTLVAFGTSMPELVVNLTGAGRQQTELVLGNVLGSNVFNLFLILGAAAIVKKLPVNRRTTWIEIPLTLAAAATLLVLGGDRLLDGAGSMVERSEGVVLLIFFGVFIAYVISLLRSEGLPPEEVALPSTEALPITHSTDIPSAGKTDSRQGVASQLVKALGGAAVLVGGAQAVVMGAEGTALRIGMSERLVALTVIAAGTSLPELVTSVTAAVKGETDLAVGNVVGSNIFNSFLVLGLSAIISPITVTLAAEIDLLVNFGATLLLFLFIFTGRGRAVERWEGGLFLLLFAGYMAAVFLL